MAEFDAACREAAVRGFELNGSGPFALFVNASAETLGDAAEQIPSTRQTVVIEITEHALVSNPDTLLRALTRFRTQGWGVAIDDVGADSRSLALMPLLYPDIIKLDLRRLQERAPEDIARIVGAVGSESERRQALVLAEGIDSEEQLAAARAFGAQLGQGFLLGAPAAAAGRVPRAGPAAAPDRLGRRPRRRRAVPARDELEAPDGRLARARRGHRGADHAPGARARRDRGRARRVPRRAAHPPRAGRRAARARRLGRLPRGALRAGRARRRGHPHRPAGARRPAARHLDGHRARARASPPASSPARSRTGPTSSPPPTTATWSWSRRC